MGGCEGPLAVELIGQMFVDDSIWAASSAEAMQRMVVLIQEFSAFHGLQLNKDKCAYFAVNVPPAGLRWKASEEDRVGRGVPFEKNDREGG